MNVIERRNAFDSCQNSDYGGGDPDRRAVLTCVRNVKEATQENKRLTRMPETKNGAPYNKPG